MIKNTKLLILGFTTLLMTYQSFSQVDSDTEPEVEQKLSLNLGVYSYNSFKENSIEDKINFRPVLSFTYNNKVEIGFSYINLYKNMHHKMPHLPQGNSISLDENKSYFSTYLKGYFGKEQNFTCQVGYTKLEHNNEQHDFITGYYHPNSTELSNERDQYKLYTRQNAISISGGYLYKVAPQFFIEAQVAYINVSRTQSNYNASVKNTADLSVYPANIYNILKGEKETFNDLQISLTITYRFTLIKKE